MGITTKVDAPFYTGSAVSSLVPEPYPVALAGQPFLIDTDPQAGHQHKSIPYLHPYALSHDTLGEKVINPNAPWRAGQSSWHKGAGQRHYDHIDSDPDRFYQSKGIDCWTRSQLTLLPDTTSSLASVNTNLRLTVCGGFLYLSDGQALKFTSDLITWTTVTGTPAATCLALTSDGATVYAAYGASGVYSTAAGTATATQWSTSPCSQLRYVKGRLMAVGQGGTSANLYNPTASGAFPAALFTHPIASFTWVGFAEGDQTIYAAGTVGDRSEVYKVPIKTDGTGLGAPIIAAPVLRGEVLSAIGSYAGFVFLGFATGVRFATTSSSGDLVEGAIIPTLNPVRCFTGWDRFVLFGWENYDAASTGLGRLDLSVLNDTAPAYASDLMVTGQGQVLGVETFNSLRVIAVSGLGVFKQSPNLVAVGTLDSGLISYRIPDDKVAFFVDVAHSNPVVGTHKEYVSTDEGAFTLVGTHAQGGAEGLFSAGFPRGGRFEMRTELDRSAALTTGPTIKHTTLLAEPAVNTGELLDIPLILAATENVEGGLQNRDPVALLAYMKGLRRTKQVVAYQDGTTAYRVIVSDFEWHPQHRTPDGSGWEGTLMVELKTVTAG